MLLNEGCMTRSSANCLRAWCKRENANILVFFQLESPELYFGHPSYESNLLRLLIKWTREMLFLQASPDFTDEWRGKQGNGWYSINDYSDGIQPWTTKPNRRIRNRKLPVRLRNWNFRQFGKLIRSRHGHWHHCQWVPGRSLPTHPHARVPQDEQVQTFQGHGQHCHHGDKCPSLVLHPPIHHPG